MIRNARRITLGLVIALAMAGPAWAGDPALTLQDPAAAGAAPAAPMPDWLTYQDPYAQASRDAGAAHMAPADVASWTQGTLTTALTIPAAGYEQMLAGQRAHFTDKGWPEYGRFLQDSRAMDVLRSGQSIATVADGEPHVVSHGAQNGQYRWLVSLPVMQSLSATTGHRQNLMIEVVRVPGNATGTADGADLRIDGLSSVAAPVDPAAVAPAAIPPTAAP